MKNRYKTGDRVKLKTGIGGEVTAVILGTRNGEYRMETTPGRVPMYMSHRTLHTILKQQASKR